MAKTNHENGTKSLSRNIVFMLLGFNVWIIITTLLENKYSISIRYRYTLHQRTYSYWRDCLISKFISWQVQITDRYSLFIYFTCVVRCFRFITCIVVCYFVFSISKSAFLIVYLTDQWTRLYVTFMYTDFINCYINYLEM